jgi:predicted GNAT family N-acyltransferase
MSTWGEEPVLKVLAGFKCKQDSDIKVFLKLSAVKYEKLNKSRTFLIYDVDSLEKDNELIILAYFTLALTVLSVPRAMSGEEIALLDGLCDTKHGVRLSNFPALLIGQLAKNSLYSASITGAEIMDFCFTQIEKGQKIIPCRRILVECKEIDYLVSFYERFGFVKLDTEHKNDDLIVFIKIE